jgi:hypothetical protein
VLVLRMVPWGVVPGCGCVRLSTTNVYLLLVAAMVQDVFVIAASILQGIGLSAAFTHGDVSRQPLDPGGGRRVGEVIRPWPGLLRSSKTRNHFAIPFFRDSKALTPHSRMPRSFLG